MTDIASLNGRRKALRLSMAEVAGRAGLNRDTVWRAFAGRVSPLHSTVQKIEGVIASEEAALNNRLNQRVPA